MNNLWDDVEFKEKLARMRIRYKEIFTRIGPIAKNVYKVQVRDLCKEYGKKFEDIWKG